MAQLIDLYLIPLNHLPIPSADAGFFGACCGIRARPAHTPSVLCAGRTLRRQSVAGRPSGACAKALPAKARRGAWSQCGRVPGCLLPPADRPVSYLGLSLIGGCPCSPLAAASGGRLAGSGDADGGTTPTAVTLPPPFPRGRIFRRAPVFLRVGANGSHAAACCGRRGHASVRGGFGCQLTCCAPPTDELARR